MKTGFYIFLDESGIDRQGGKTTIVLIYVSAEKMRALEEVVLDTEKMLGIDYFHWAHSSWRIRSCFAEIISSNDFKIKAVLTKNPFYADTDYIAALKCLATEKNISCLIVDGKKGKNYERKFKRILRDKGIPVGKLKTADDQTFPILRIADLAAGTIRRAYDNPDDERIKRIYEKISNKIIKFIEY